MTASTTVPLALVVPVTVVTGSVKSMVFKFPTDEECLTYKLPQIEHDVVDSEPRYPPRTGRPPTRYQA